MTEFVFETLDMHNHAHVEEFTKFHNIIFPNTHASQEWIEWYAKFGDIYHDINTRVYVARRVDDNVIVGSWCVEPKRFHDGKTTVKIGRCFSVGIHPDVRRQNLFVRLSNHAIESERQHKNYKTIIGFPQVGRPIIPAHIKSGWRELEVIPVLGKKPENFELSLSHVIKNWIDEVNVAPWKVGVNSIVESSHYLQRRWLEHPDNDYIVLATKEFPHSFIVLKHYGSIMHVLSIRGGKTGACLLLKAASTLAFRHNCSELNAWCASRELYRDVLEETGFAENVSQSPNIQVMCVDLTDDYRLNIEQDCVFHQGTEEAY